MALASLTIGPTDAGTVCRFRQPICAPVHNNDGIYRGDEENWCGGGDPETRVFLKGAHHDLMSEAFGGVGVRVCSSDVLRKAVFEALESGNFGNLKPQSVVARRFYPQARKN